MCARPHPHQLVPEYWALVKGQVSLILSDSHTFRLLDTRECCPFCGVGLLGSKGAAESLSAPKAFPAPYPAPIHHF